MKKKDIVFFTFFVSLMCVASCEKDHDIPTGEVFNEYTINVSANPAVGGMVSGGGIWQRDQYCTVKAKANTHYAFVNWTENGNLVSTDAEYTFLVHSDRTLKANFAALSDLMLNELNGNDKFIEIYNKSELEFPLNGFYIEKNNRQIWVGDYSTIIPSHGFLLLYGEEVMSAHPGYSNNLIFYSELTGGETFQLSLYSPAGIWIDKFTRGTTGEWGMSVLDVSPKSFARTPDGGDWKLANPTPGEINPGVGEDIPQDDPPVPDPEEPDSTILVINELNGDTKFIEFYNKGDIDLSMEGMYIMKDDYVAGSTWTGDATIVVPAHGYMVLYSIDVAVDHPELGENMFFHSGLSSKKTTRFALFLPDGTEVDEFTRGTTGEWGQTISNVAPQSYTRTPDGGDWKLADPTPGYANPQIGDVIPQE